MSILGRQNRQLTSFGEQPDAEGTPGAGRLPLNVLALVVVCLGVLVLRLSGVPLSADCPLGLLNSILFLFEGQQGEQTTHGSSTCHSPSLSTSMNPTSPDRGFCILRCTATPKRVTDPLRKRVLSAGVGPVRPVDPSIPFHFRRTPAKPFSPSSQRVPRHANPNGRDIGLIVGPPAPTLPPDASCLFQRTGTPSRRTSRVIRVKAERIHSTGRQADTGSFQRTSFECEASLGHKESLKKKAGLNIP